ncbi:MAG: hypothetical protein AB1630_04385, partial [bacterium]
MENDIFICMCLALMEQMKSEIRNSKQIQMTKIENSKQYNLKERTLMFAKQVRRFVKKISKTISNIEDGKQVIRSSIMRKS